MPTLVPTLVTRVMGEAELQNYREKREELLRQLAPRQPAEMRAEALIRITELTVGGDAVRLAIWSDRPVADAVRVAAESGSWQDVVVRTHALAVLWNVSSAPANKEPMWEDRQVRQVVIKCAQRQIMPEPAAEATTRQYPRGHEPVPGALRGRSTSALRLLGASGGLPDEGGRTFSATTSMSLPTEEEASDLSKPKKYRKAKRKARRKCRSPKSKSRRSKSPRSKSPRSKSPRSKSPRSKSSRSKSPRWKSPRSKSRTPKSPRPRSPRSKSPQSKPLRPKATGTKSSRSPSPTSRTQAQARSKSRGKAKSKGRGNTKTKPNSPRGGRNAGAMPAPAAREPHPEASSPLSVNWFEDPDRHLGPACSTCGQQFALGALFCSTCGSNRPPPKQHCSRCGAIVGGGTLICTSCGHCHNGTRQTCSKCGSNCAADLVICDTCGWKLPHSPVVCGVCGDGLGADEICWYSRRRARSSQLEAGSSFGPGVGDLPCCAICRLHLELQLLPDPQSTDVCQYCNTVVAKADMYCHMCGKTRASQPHVGSEAVVDTKVQRTLSDLVKEMQEAIHTDDCDALTSGAQVPNTSGSPRKITQRFRTKARDITARMKQMRLMWTRGRLNALSVLKSLSVAGPALQESMWEDHGARDALLAGTEDQELDVRARAVATLKNLAAASRNREAMWQDVRLRGAILSSMMQQIPLEDGTNSNSQSHYMAEVRQHAVCAFCNLTAADANVESMWRNKECQQSVLHVLQSRDAFGVDIWAKTLRIVKNFASANANKPLIWQDECFRQELVVAAMATRPEELDVRVKAVAALWRLSGAAANQIGMRQDGKTFSALVCASQSREHELLLKGLGALQNLAVAPENEVPMWRDERVRAVLVQALEDNSPLEVRVKAADTLTNLSAAHPNQEAMWANGQLRDRILHCAQPSAQRLAAGVSKEQMARAGASKEQMARAGASKEEMARELQDKAVTVLLSLAHAAVNRVSMWHHPHGREVLLASAKLRDDTLGIRSKALGCLWTLATSPRNRESMWHSHARDTLISSAEPTGHDDSHEVQQGRTFAVAALRCLAGAPNNRETMWLDRRLRAALLVACRPAKHALMELRVHALGALRNLADSLSTKEIMWRDAAVRNAIALGMEAEHPSELGVRINSVGALRHLGSFAANRGVYVWRDLRFWGALLKAAEPSHNGCSEYSKGFARPGLPPELVDDSMAGVNEGPSRMAEVEECVARHFARDASRPLSFEELQRIGRVQDWDGTGSDGVEDLLNLIGLESRGRRDQQAATSQQNEMSGRSLCAPQTLEAREALRQEATQAIIEICGAPAVRSQACKDQVIPPALRPLVAGKVNADFWDLQQEPPKLQRSKTPPPPRPPFRPAGINVNSVDTHTLDLRWNMRSRLRSASPRRREVKKPLSPNKPWEARFLYMTDEELAAEAGVPFRVQVTIQGIEGYFRKQPLGPGGAQPIPVASCVVTVGGRGREEAESYEVEQVYAVLPTPADGGEHLWSRGFVVERLTSHDTMSFELHADPAVKHPEHQDVQQLVGAARLTCGQVLPHGFEGGIALEADVGSSYQAVLRVQISVLPNPVQEKIVKVKQKMHSPSSGQRNDAVLAGAKESRKGVKKQVEPHRLPSCGVHPRRKDLRKRKQRRMAKSNFQVTQKVIQMIRSHAFEDEAGMAVRQDFVDGLAKNGSGDLSYKQMKQVFRESFGISVKDATDRQISDLLRIIDTDGSGTISIEELLEVAKDRRDFDKLSTVKQQFPQATMELIARRLKAASCKDGVEDIEAMFEVLDKDASGELDFSEWKSALREAAGITPDEVRDEDLVGLFKLIDKDNTGLIDVNEVMFLVTGG